MRGRVNKGLGRDVYRILFALIPLILFAPTSRAWDPVKQMTGRNANDLIEHHIEKAGTAVQKLAHDPIGYLARLPASLVADICSAPTQRYEGILAGQANGRWKSLPSNLIAAIQPSYSVDLTSIRYATGVGVVNAPAVTFGYKIYFERGVDLTNQQDLWTMLHELEHTVQYARSSQGDAGELCEYTAKAIGNGFQHDRIDMEQAADRKANSVFNAAWWAMTNVVPHGLASADKLNLNQLVVFNDTDVDVQFWMSSQYVQEEQIVMPARSWTVFTATPNDTWFNVFIGTDTWRGPVSITYGLDGGTRQHIQTDAYGVYDFFHE